MSSLLQNSSILRSRLPLAFVLLAALAAVLTISWQHRRSSAEWSLGSDNANPSIPDQSRKTSSDSRSVALSDKLNEVFNSTLGFEKVFAISLPERTDRRDSIALTSAITGFEVEFIDGVRGDSVLDKALPAEAGDGELKGGGKGSWRAHMNAMRQIIQKGYGSALIAEEDFDWDHRLKQQLLDFATASTGILSQYPGDNVPRFGKSRGDILEFSELSQWLYSSLKTVPASNSPYGQGWDVLWLGNCMVHINDIVRDDWQPLSVMKRDDPTTMPSNQYWALDWDGAIGTAYRPFPNHTRLFISQPSEQTCTYAYAVSQKGARKILLELGLERADRPFDIMLRDFCQGGWKGGLAEPHACWGVMPTIFSTYTQAGRTDRATDINDDRESTIISEGFSLNLQQSVRKNARKILADQTDQIVDAYPYSPGT